MRALNLRSPFFVQFATVEDQANCEVRIWVGEVTSGRPASATYLLTKETTSGQATFEVAELARDFLSHNSSLSSGYAFMEIYMTDGTANSTDTYFCTEGYTIYDQGLQSDSQTEVKDTLGLPLDTDGSARILLAEGGTNNLPIFRTVQGPGVDSLETFDLAGSSSGVTTYSSNSLSTGKVRNKTVNAMTSKLISKSDDVDTTIWVDVLDCNKWEVMKVLYVNKQGMKTYFPFILKSTEKIGISSDNFNRSLVDYSALTNGNNLHASRKRITGTKQTYALNTDWMAEYYVQQIEELMLSEYVWLQKESGNPIPVNIKDSSFDKKTHINDKTIQYTINVETAANYINTVR